MAFFQLDPAQQSGNICRSRIMPKARNSVAPRTRGQIRLGRTDGVAGTGTGTGVDSLD